MKYIVATIWLLFSIHCLGNDHLRYYPPSDNGRCEHDFEDQLYSFSKSIETSVYEEFIYEEYALISNKGVSIEGKIEDTSVPFADGRICKTVCNTSVKEVCDYIVSCIDSALDNGGVCQGIWLIGKRGLKNACKC